jgi:hypothetical protein
MSMMRSSTTITSAVPANCGSSLQAGRLAGAIGGLSSATFSVSGVSEPASA